MPAYNPAINSAIYDLHAGKRDKMAACLPLPAQWQDDVVEAYIAFLSADATEVSDSQYAGRHQVKVFIIIYFVVQAPRKRKPTIAILSDNLLNSKLNIYKIWIFIFYIK